MGTIKKQALEREEIICREGKRVSELTAEKERLQDEVKELSERVRACETKVLGPDEEIRKKEGEHCSDQLSNSPYEIKKLQQQVTELSEKLQASQVKLSEQEESIKRREGEVNHTVSLENARLQHRLKELTDRFRLDEIKALEREKEIKNRETEQLSKSTAETDRLKEHLLTTNKKVKDLVKEFEEKLDAAEKKDNEQERIRTKQVEQLSNAEAEQERLQHQLSELRDTKELEQEEFMKREAERFSQTTIEREGLEDQVRELVEKLRASQIQENEVNKLKAQLSASLQYESEARDLKTQLKHSEDKIGRLTEKITDITTVHERKEAKLTEKSSKESEENFKVLQEMAANMARHA